MSFENGVTGSVSTYSSMSECDQDSDHEQDTDMERPGHVLSRKERDASHETLSTTVTSADEFVWIDSHNR